MEQRKRNYIGSITVEAALVLPLFLYGIMALMYVFQVFYVQECIQAGLTQVAREASRYGYVYDDLLHSGEESKEEIKQENEQGNEQEIKTEKKPDTEEMSGQSEGSFILEKIIEGSFYKVRLEQYLDDCNMSDSCILGGRAGITLLLSSFMEQGKNIDIVAMYRVKIPVTFFGKNGFSMIQRVRTRGFVGLDESDTTGDHEKDGVESEEQLVYITEHGTVYHFKRDCSYIRLSIHAVLFSQCMDLRNQGGETYKPCERCTKNAKLSGQDRVFITEDGNRYHTTLDCSGLKRTVIAIPISQVEGRKACQRCH